MGSCCLQRVEEVLSLPGTAEAGSRAPARTRSSAGFPQVRFAAGRGSACTSLAVGSLGPLRKSDLHRLQIVLGGTCSQSCEHFLPAAFRLSPTPEGGSLVFLPAGFALSSVSAVLFLLFVLLFFLLLLFLLCWPGLSAPVFLLAACGPLLPTGCPSGAARLGRGPREAGGFPLRPLPPLLLPIPVSSLWRGASGSPASFRSTGVLRERQVQLNLREIPQCVGSAWQLGQVLKGGP